MTTNKLERPGFHISHKAWYRRHIQNQEILIGNYAEDNDSYEFSICWYALGGPLRPPAAKLEVYDEAWGVLAEFVRRFDLINRLAELGEDSTPEDVVKMLLEIGLEDLTAYQVPGGYSIESVRRRALAKLTAEERVALCWK